MPKIAVFKNFYFFIFSGDLKERRHIHIAKEKNFFNAAKFWLEPDVTLSDKGDLSEKEIRTLTGKITQNKTEILNQIGRFAHGEKIKLLRIK